MSYDGIVRLDARIFKVDLVELVKFILNHPVDATLTELVVMKWKPAKWESLWSETFGRGEDRSRQKFIHTLLGRFGGEEEINRDLARWFSNELCFHPTWIVTDPFFESVVTEFVPRLKKRKEPEPEIKFIGTVHVSSPSKHDTFHWFTFDDQDEAHHALNALESLHQAFDETCDTNYIDLSKISPFKSKDMLGFIDRCQKK
jgi:hypothetical protein